MDNTRRFIGLFDNGIATAAEVREVVLRELSLTVDLDDRAEMLGRLVKRSIYTAAEARAVLGLVPAELPRVAGESNEIDPSSDDPEDILDVITGTPAKAGSRRRKVSESNA